MVAQLLNKKWRVGWLARARGRSFGQRLRRARGQGGGGAHA